MAIGRPRKWNSPEEMYQAGLDYFARQDAAERPYTITGLARALDMTRQGLLEYQARGNFSAAVKALKGIVEERVEERLMGGGGNIAGPIFWLKNNGAGGWVDKQEVKTEGDAKLIISWSADGKPVESASKSD